MAISRSTVTLLSGTVIGAGALVNPSSDLLGSGSNSVGEFTLRLKVVGAAAGSVDVAVGTTDGLDQYPPPNAQVNVPVINGTANYTLGRFAACRYVCVVVQNNDGSNAITVDLTAELEKLS